MSDAYSYNAGDYIGANTNPYTAEEIGSAVASAYEEVSNAYTDNYSDSSIAYAETPTGNPYSDLYSDEAEAQEASGAPEKSDSDQKPLKFVGKAWNEEFQRILENEKGYAKYKMLSELAADFVYAAQTYGQIIISESSLPVEQKTIKPVGLGGIAGGEKFICQNILFKFALDSSGLYGSDEAAMKSASNELKGLMSYYNLQIEGICFPLMALIDFRGFRLVAISMLPIGKDTIIYGSSDAGATVHDDDPEFNSKMKRAAEILNIKGHIVGKTEKKELFSCGDIEGHKGDDGRFYLLDFGRVFPPQVRMIKDFKRRHLYELLRPEHVAANVVPLSSDALTAWGANDPNAEQHNDEVRSATARIYTKSIPDFAAQLDSMSDDAISKMRLTEELHRHGINVRHLGFVRSAARKASARRRILMECIARTMKSEIQMLLRKKNRELMIPSDEPYRKVTLQFLNSALSRQQVFWERIRMETQLKFISSISDEEKASTPNFIKAINFHELLVRFQELTGINLSPQALEELVADPSSATLRLVDPDIESIGATVKYMNLIEHSAGVVLAHEAAHCTGRASDRLFAMADSKFRRSLERTPNSSLTLFDWGKMLHAQAQRCVDALKTQDDAPEETAAQLAERLSLQRNKSVGVPTQKSKSPAETRVSRTQSTTVRLSRFPSSGLRRVSSSRPSDSIMLTHTPVVDPVALQNKAKASFMSGEEKLRRALKIKPEYAEARLELAHLLYDYGCFLVALAYQSPNEDAKYELSDLGAKKLLESLSIDTCRMASLTQKSSEARKEFLNASDFASARDAFVEARALLVSVAENMQTDGNAFYEVGFIYARYCSRLLARSGDPELFDRYIISASHSFRRALELKPDLMVMLERFLQLDGKPDDFIVFSQIGLSVPVIYDTLKMRCQNVSSLNLPNCVGVTEESIQSLISACVQLRHLSVDGSKQITDSTMRLIASSCQSLEFLSCRDCKAITMGPVQEKGSESLLSAVRSALSGASPLSAIGLSDGVLGVQNIGASLVSSSKTPSIVAGGEASAFISKCSATLQFLDLSGCSLVESKHVVALSIFEKLESLIISGVNKIVDADFIKLMESSRQIISVSVSDCFQLTASAFASVSKLNRLVSLSVSNCKGLSDDGLIAALKSCTSLQLLDISQNKGISEAALKSVASSKCPFREFNLAGCDGVTDPAMKALLKRAGSNLRTLDISNCPQVTDSSISYLSKYCPNVVDLRLAGTKITSKAMESLSKGCTMLEKFDISGCDAVSTGLCDLLASCPLNELHASGCSFSADDICAAFSENKVSPKKSGAALKFLDLSDMRVPDQAIDRIVMASPLLRTLKLNQCGQLTDLALAKLAELENLTDLHLDNSFNLTDSGIASLFSSGNMGKTLRSLSLKKCPKLTDDSMLVIAENARGLTRLLLAKWRLNISSVRSLLESCIDLVDLLIEHCSELSITDTRAMIKSEFKRCSALIM